MGFIDSYRRARDGNYSYEVNGVVVKCSHCGGTNFDRRDVQLNTQGLTFFNLDWLNESATVFECLDCGHLEWFNC